MNPARNLFILVLLGIGAYVLLSSLYTVNEIEQRRSA